MKLTVTKKELCSLLTKACEFSVTDIEIVEDPKLNPVQWPAIYLYASIIEGLANELRVNFRDVNSAVFTNSRKIESIKALRAVTCEISKRSMEGQNGKLPGDIMGLGEAKNAVERWGTWIGSVQTHNKYPTNF